MIDQGIVGLLTTLTRLSVKDNTNKIIQSTADFVYVFSQDTTQCCASHVTALSPSNGATVWTFGAPSQVAGQFVLD